FTAVCLAVAGSVIVEVGDQAGGAHPGHTALAPDVGRYPLEGHNRDGAGVLGDLGLLRRDHVHDHAAFEHLGQSSLDPPGAAPIVEPGAHLLHEAILPPPPYNSCAMRASRRTRRQQVIAVIVATALGLPA